MKGKRSVTCGLCPCIKRPACTFEDTDLVRCALSPTSKLRSYNAAQIQAKTHLKVTFTRFVCICAFFVVPLSGKMGNKRQNVLCAESRKKNEM